MALYVVSPEQVRQRKSSKGASETVLRCCDDDDGEETSRKKNRIKNALYDVRICLFLVVVARQLIRYCVSEDMT